MVMFSKLTRFVLAFRIADVSFDICIFFLQVGQSPLKIVDFHLIIFPLLGSPPTADLLATIN
jgi:hypothetical protein